LNVIDVGVGGDFTGQHHQTGVAQRFGGHAGFRVLGQNGVQNGVGNLVGDLVGMAFRDGFGSEKIIVRHRKLLIWFEKYGRLPTACDALAIFIFASQVVINSAATATWYFTLF
jgi:hypothetical protein